MTGPTIGALCAGYGGLDLAVRDVLGGELAWVAENDPAASKVLAHRFPGVPNLGDITGLDWTSVPRVDVVTAGFPCTDVSVAGRGLGIAPGTRSGLWLHIARGLAVLRPRLVVIENVRGLLSAKADRGGAPAPDLDPLLRHLLETADVEAAADPGWFDLGSRDEDMGDPDGARPVLLRALGAVLGDLADLGLDAEWTGLRAADVGACHGRFRVGILAWPAADTASDRRDEAPADARRHARTEADPHRPAAGRGGRAAADTDRVALRLEPVTLAGSGGPAVPGLPGGQRSTPADPSGPAGDLAWIAVPGDGQTAPGGRGPAPLGRPAAGLHVEPIPGAGHRDRERGPAEGVHQLGRATPVLAWGPYTAAIRRWELTLGRPAPAPTEPGTKGQPRLSPRFVEFMQGLPEGWVTDVPDLSRNDMLRILGNGVVPQQFSAVVRILLHRAFGAVAA